jgi:N-acyl-D-aspartate/D-glutamate deacylase
MYDLIIRGGMIVDGSGAPARPGSVAISGGRIAAVGDLGDATAKREIDAAGKVIAPGFVDVHTHYDAQVFWDPTLSPSCYHGVTTVMAGNCGFSIAPLTPQTAPYLTRMLARVEGMPVESLIAGVPWDWSSFAEFLGRLEGRVGINIGFMAGHSAIRTAVMGERALQGAATPEDLAAMEDVLDRSLAAGALGFSTSTAASHNDAEGLPVPSRHAEREEFLALAAVCRRHEGTGLEIVPGVTAHTDEQRNLMADMSAAAKRPLNWNVLAVGTDPSTVEHQLEVCRIAQERGGEVIALTTAEPMGMIINLHSGMIFDVFPGWAPLFQLPVPERIARLQDPAARAELKRQAEAYRGPLAHVTHWADLTISTSANQALIGRTVGDVAAERGTDPFDTLIDLAIADGLKTGFHVKGSGDTAEAWARRGELWKDPRTIIGASDAGAHLDMIDQFAYTSVILGKGVRERGLISLEEAVHELTHRPAELLGLRERGLLREGWWADIVVFDPATVGCTPVYMRHDVPGDQMRLYADPIGVSDVIVNGEVIVANGEHTGTLPGTVLKSGRDTATRQVGAGREPVPA